MCRIAGVINPSLPSQELISLVKGMCKTLEHGGPDDEGIYANEGSNLVLGHRRLSIIDITQSGHQPMLYAEGRYVISYNGELYNYKELKKELEQAGAYFTTQSDTEIIIAAYAIWGTASLERFSGMFAFAIWDNVNNELLIARDTSGIKPLYYSFVKEGLAFASEVKAFKNIPWLKDTNNSWPVYLMAYGHLPEPVTTLKHVRPLEKGHYLVYKTHSNTLEVKSFSRFTYLEKVNDRQEAIHLIKEKLEEAVKKHLISDAPIGVFLSGGLDSGIIAALANKHQQQLKTISIYFDNNEYSEKKYQDVLQQQLGCQHQQFLITENNFHTYLPGIVQSMDLPSCDGINTWFISKYARESGLKAVLSGIGGDELYGGYPSFRWIKTTLALSHLPHSLLKAGSSISAAKKFRRLVYLNMNGAVGKYLFLRGQFVPADIAKFLNMAEDEVWNILSEQPQLPGIDYLSPGNQASWMEINLYMQNQLLRDADVMSMSHGLEIRVPFLDKQFVDTTLKIQSAVKYDGKLGKQLLIDAFKDMIPEVIWNRPKMGFTFPFKEWLSNQSYATGKDGADLSIYHTKLVNNQMHWSQFFTLLLLHSYGNE